MKKLYFATTNEGKLKEAKSILKVEVVGTPLEIDEVQSMDPIEVATKKARLYFEKLRKPIFVEDVSVFIKALNGLPGPYIDAFMKTLGNEGIVKLLRGANERSVTAQATVVYIPKMGVEEVFIGEVEGTISDKPRGEGFGWDPIFIPKGEKKTFGEITLEEKNKYSMRAKALKKFKKWLEKEM
ncbi:non-canonical purine NTP pyrophosphatase, RdgB/HAM1 family [Candidatus Woesebacteria bacterium RIFCSPHIGHO2_01_FULL_39_32]|uniref:Non-canonical purine NTP pyrophosphatase, RdgB/HAM1 family n=1 Tax=Candidatus Woesebacteria bacterium RIFCSPLOWO2_01_FULL_39_25 TaxID=1802521 RepID=A0A1F8BLS5_9BACT|nr:MAG: non-canonical purine NTP pyrophosphatase, RdgB/HAM1 family [Candidatus Woesebacteria bacterium GWB1_37_5]OGM25486.1 MAG: non-canonical purine NTP pyrophosphatase, RdgB/HAM1 family [Candidatus Woesebacteria bacterium RIFCSPHIGHO2_01_FULL_39_32]OGM38741.1 MAG: non-canonical purine NTP pyrophosphatase, RdgB/HAM1 family [Candidatus Woesebacteria bacterium RIFCSPHIGHO2_12_FULL_38_11]OGM65017.1 MAG: non-canonical purine NTP pyrophosphatase, RdgB/HAM1 family [Candidatus Woesebacteria bacterium 